MEVFWNFLCEEIISILALIVSVLTFLYNHKLNRCNIAIKDYEVTQHNNENGTHIEIKCRIENHSSNPITITTVKLNNIPAFSHKVLLRGGSYIKFKTKIEEKIESIEFPLKLDAYEAKDGVIIFDFNNSTKLKYFNIIRFYTTRNCKTIIHFKCNNTK